MIVVLKYIICLLYMMPRICFSLIPGWVGNSEGWRGSKIVAGHVLMAEARQWVPGAYFPILSTFVCVWNSHNKMFKNNKVRKFLAYCK